MLQQNRGCWWGGGFPETAGRLRGMREKEIVPSWVVVKFRTSRKYRLRKLKFLKLCERLKITENVF